MDKKKFSFSDKQIKYFICLLYEFEIYYIYFPIITEIKFIFLLSL